MLLQNRHTRPLEGKAYLSYVSCVEVNGVPEVALVQGRHVVVLVVGEGAWEFFQQASPEQILALAEEKQDLW